MYRHIFLVSWSSLVGSSITVPVLPELFHGTESGLQGAMMTQRDNYASASNLASTLHLSHRLSTAGICTSGSVTPRGEPTLNVTASEVSAQVAVDRMAKQVKHLQDQFHEAARTAEDTRELRRLFENAGSSAQDFKGLLDAESHHRQQGLEAEREVRNKEFADTHAALQVARGRLSRLEGTQTVHTTRLKEIDDLADQIQNLQHHFDALRRAFEMSETERKVWVL